jgi:hypothetical protein
MEQVWPFYGMPNWQLLSVLFFLLIIWSAVWKGIALWRAGRNSHLAWFIVMLIINTAGILEIIYIFAFSRKKQNLPQAT